MPKGEKIKDFIEKIVLPKEERERRRKVRQRQSYRFWKEMYEIVSKGDVEEILRKVFVEIDRRRGFGSRSVARYHLESLTLLLKDKKGVI